MRASAWASCPNLVTRDYATIYTATNLLPSWVGGIIFCGIFAAIIALKPTDLSQYIINFALGGIHAFVPSWIFSFILIFAVSLATQNDRVKLGVFQVFFCKDYDEKYATMDTLTD